MTIQVTARDLDNGAETRRHLRPGQYVVICADPMHVAHQQRRRDGTVVLTLKRRDSQ